MKHKEKYIKEWTEAFKNAVAIFKFSNKMYEELSSHCLILGKSQKARTAWTYATKAISYYEDALIQGTKGCLNGDSPIIDEIIHHELSQEDKRRIKIILSKNYPWIFEEGEEHENK
jgi:hypothetical protein